MHFKGLRNSNFSSYMKNALPSMKTHTTITTTTTNTSILITTQYNMVVESRTN